MGVEECQCAIPRQSRRLFVVARRGVVVEPVVRALVDMGGVGLPVRLERRLIGGPAGVDAGVELAIVDQQRRLNDEFIEAKVQWTEGAPSYEYRMQVIAPDGVIELCGAGVFTNAQFRRATISVLKDRTLTLNGKPILHRNEHIGLGIAA